MTVNRAYAPRMPRPALVLAGALAATVVLMMLPPSIAEPLRSCVQEALFPVVSRLADAREAIAAQFTRLRHLTSGADRVAELEQEIALLRGQNQELETALVALQATGSANDVATEPATLLAPLVVPELISARVLGQQAQAILLRQGLLEAGADRGVAVQDWVVDAPASLFDSGSAAGLSRGDLVLAGRRVVGKISSVSQHTSHLLRCTDAGYRELVQLASEFGGQLKLGPQGVLEGTGQGECRVRLIGLTEPVSPGDLVVSTGGEGFLPTPLWYGRVSRVASAPGASHWEIWMQPAIDDRLPDAVGIIRAAPSQRLNQPSSTAQNP